MPGQANRQDAVRLGLRLATQPGITAEPPALTIAVTQTDDGATIAIAVAGLPGERCSFSSFDLRPGSHSIDIGFEALQALNGWAFRADRHGPPPSAEVNAA